MPTPPYIRKLREQIGSDYLWLSGATAVVYRGRDSLRCYWCAVAITGVNPDYGHCGDPGRASMTCLREAQEEANVQIEVLELAQVKADPAMSVR